MLENLSNIFALILFCFPEQTKRQLLELRKYLISFLLTEHFRKFNTPKARQWRFLAGTENRTNN
jgi:hypothetical protein